MQQLTGAEAVLGLGAPLVLLAEAPEQEDAGEDAGDGDGEPGALGHLDERGGEVQAVDGGEEEPGEDDEEGGEAPDDQGREGHHAGVEEGHEHDADTEGLVNKMGVLLGRGGGVVGSLTRTRYRGESCSSRCR